MRPPRRRSLRIATASPRNILTFHYLLIYFRSIGMQHRRPPPTGGNQIQTSGQTPNKNSGDIDMKKIIAIAAVLATAQASAWWGGNGWDNNYNNGYGYGNGYTNGVFDGVGDAHGEGNFSMNFSGRGHTNMRGYGNGYGYGDGWGRGYNYAAPGYGYAPYAYAPMAPMAPVAPQAEAAAE
jgi:hypothetical protein